MDTYLYYNRDIHPMRPEDLCEAGFFYEGPGDKVRCFWCDGALELWTQGDDAWLEHAKQVLIHVFVLTVMRATIFEANSR